MKNPKYFFNRIACRVASKRQGRNLGEAVTD